MRIAVADESGDTATVKNFALQIIPHAKAPQTHVLRVEVVDATGRECPEYAQNMMVQRGAGTLRLPLALSDPGGTWHLRVRDVATGVAATARFQYKPE